MKGALSNVLDTRETMECALLPVIRGRIAGKTLDWANDRDKASKGDFDCTFYLNVTLANNLYSFDGRSQATGKETHVSDSASVIVIIDEFTVFADLTSSNSLK